MSKRFQSFLACWLLLAVDAAGEGMHLRPNPLAGTTMYVNPDWAENAGRALARAHPSDAALIAKIREVPTAVWLDSIGALQGGAANDGRRSIIAHLDAAAAQATASGKPGSVVFVVYNLPNRDCAAAASNGQLVGIAGLATYKAQYIDVIAEALSRPAYRSLRVVLVIEPDSLPNLITNADSVPACAEAARLKLYEDGVSYAIQKLGALPNAFLYLDIAHSGWLGWPHHMTKALSFYTTFIKTATAGRTSMVRGFATDVSNYTPLLEPFVDPSNRAVLNGPFYQGNPVFDELTYVRTLASDFTGAGLPNMRFLIDTSRSGWRQVNGSDGRIDRRRLRGNWCNVNGAGLGERPRIAPPLDPHIDAFVWIKPPGESDGSSTPFTDTDAWGRRFDRHCSNQDTSPDANLDAMDDAPPAGSFFEAQFLMLLRNATPPLTAAAPASP